MFWRDESDEGERAKFRTECWIERCIFEERICPPEEHVVFTPLKINTPVEGTLLSFIPAMYLLFFFFVRLTTCV